MTSSERKFQPKQANRAYNRAPAAQVDSSLYSRLSESAWRNIQETFTVPARSGLAWGGEGGADLQGGHWPRLPGG